MGKIINILFFKLWPIWIWLASRWLFGVIALGSEYYRAAQTIAPLLLFAMAHFLFTRGRENTSVVMLLLVAGSIFSGILGGIAEYGRWTPYLGRPE